MTIDKIYLSQESANQTVDFNHLNTEVIVKIGTGFKYRANFICVTELEKEFEKEFNDSKNVAKKYFWSKNLVIVKNITKNDLLPIIENMIDEGDFQLIFEKM
ncbi:hypothetical protein OO013_08310 [Mangrovivirga sp. M17]|uniref:Uncharacterized protein n=1 Tax=Mangrovivirga halotolerans TaxID=2993936 RepID=A0ABT3RQH6_9BACT|nr:hypothetical protein [Mangrovivirga halotolerans]MCX2743865.1 hypothetical protein [Mangrovivirga halotolerans]